jgi:F0F1-type ATP synthase assembly protein I
VDALSYCGNEHKFSFNAISLPKVGVRMNNALDRRVNTKRSEEIREHRISSSFVSVFLLGATVFVI